MKWKISWNHALRIILTNFWQARISTDRNKTMATDLMLLSYIKWRSDSGNLWSVVVQKRNNRKICPLCSSIKYSPLSQAHEKNNLEARDNLVAWYYIVGAMITGSKEGYVSCGLVSRSKYRVHLSHPSMKFYSFFKDFHSVTNAWDGSLHYEHNSYATYVCGWIIYPIVWLSRYKLMQGASPWMTTNYTSRHNFPYVNTTNQKAGNSFQAAADNASCRQRIQYH